MLIAIMSYNGEALAKRSPTAANGKYWLAKYLGESGASMLAGARFMSWAEWANARFNSHRPL